MRLVLAITLAAAACGGSRHSSPDASPDAVTGSDGAVPDAATPDARPVTPDAKTATLDARTGMPDAIPLPPIYCGHPADCAGGQTCGPDGACHLGDCAAVGCIFGYGCQGDGTCGPTGCDKDSDCTGACLAGDCTATSDLCVDASQCPAGDHCADGRCVLACGSNVDCRDGYLCDLTLGVCSIPIKGCTITNDCGQAGQVCTDAACVPRSSGATCPDPGDVWFENGCVPDPHARVDCATDGVMDVCATGSICLDHSCWISCDSPNQTACDTQPTLNTCKPLGAHDVCATASSVGNECSPISPCGGAQSCVDGFCK